MYTSVIQLIPLMAVLVLATPNKDVIFPLSGNWTLHGRSENLSQSQGLIRIYLPRLLNKTPNITYFEDVLQITDGMYGQDRVIEFSCLVWYQTNSTQASGYLASKSLTPMPMRVLRQQFLAGNVTVNLPTLNLTITNPDTDNFSMNGTINWADTTVTFNVAPFDSAHFEQVAMPYLGIVLVAAVIQSFASVQQMDRTTTESSLRRSSYSTLMIIATSDAYLCQIHIYLAALFSSTCL